MADPDPTLPDRNRPCPNQILKNRFLRLLGKFNPFCAFCCFVCAFLPFCWFLIRFGSFCVLNDFCRLLRGSVPFCSVRFLLRFLLPVQTISESVRNPFRIEPVTGRDTFYSVCRKANADANTNKNGAEPFLILPRICFDFSENENGFLKIGFEKSVPKKCFFKVLTDCIRLKLHLIKQTCLTCEFLEPLFLFAEIGFVYLAPYKI